MQCILASYLAINYAKFLVSIDEWSEWRFITECSATCGGGVIEKVRDCKNPTQSLDGGGKCRGLNKATEKCNDFPCS